MPRQTYVPPDHMQQTVLLLDREMLEHLDHWRGVHSPEGAIFTKTDAINIMIAFGLTAHRIKALPSAAALLKMTIEENNPAPEPVDHSEYAPVEPVPPERWERPVTIVQRVIKVFNRAYGLARLPRLKVQPRDKDTAAVWTDEQLMPDEFVLPVPKGLD